MLTEAAANLVARRGRFAALGLVVATVTAALVWADLTAARTAVASKQEFLAAGGAVVLVEAKEGGLDAATCAAASELPYVVAAGGTRTGDVVAFDHAPGTPLRTVRTSGDVLRVIDPRAGPNPGSGVLLPRSAASEIGVVAGSSLYLQGDLLAVDAVVDPEPRAIQLSRSVLIPEAPTGDVEQCWVELIDGASESGTDTLLAWFAGEQLTLTPLVSRNLATRDLAGDWAGRPQRHGWLAGAFVITAFAMFLVWRRRAELSLYVLLGTARPVVAVLQTLELVVVITAGGLLGGLWGVALAGLAGEPGGPALVHGLRAGALTLVFTMALLPVLAAWLLRTDMVAALKERPG